MTVKRRAKRPLKPRSAYPFVRLQDCPWCGDSVRMERRGTGERQDTWPSDPRERNYYYIDSDGHEDECEDTKAVRRSLHRFNTSGPVRSLSRRNEAAAKVRVA